MNLPATFGTKHSGFTLVELVIILGLTLVVAVLVLPAIGAWVGGTDTREAAAGLADNLALTRERSRAGQNANAHGLHLALGPVGGTYTVYTGATYLSRNQALDEVRTLPVTITVTTTWPGGDINFSKGLAVPNGTGTVTLVGNDGHRVVVEVFASGLVEIRDQ